MQAYLIFLTALAVFALAYFSRDPQNDQERERNSDLYWSHCTGTDRDHHSDNSDSVVDQLV